MKPRITDCLRTTFVEAGAELCPATIFPSEKTIAQPHRPERTADLPHHPPSSWHSESLIDTGIRSQKYIQNP